MILRWVLSGIFGKCLRLLGTIMYMQNAHHRNYFRRQGKSFNCFEMMILEAEKARQVCLEGYFISFKNLRIVPTIYFEYVILAWRQYEYTTITTSLFPKDSSSRDKVIRLIWPVLKEQAGYLSMITINKAKIL